MFRSRLCLLVSLVSTTFAFSCTGSDTPSQTANQDWQPTAYESVSLSEDDLAELKELEKTARRQYDVEDFEGCAATYAAAAKIYDGNDSDYYNQACCLALAGHPHLALLVLDKAVASGWWSTGSFDADEDLASVRELPDFAALVERTHALEAADAGESFDSLEDLEDHFAELRADLREPERRALGQNASRDARWQIAGEHIAALDAFGEANPEHRDLTAMWALDIFAGLDPTPASLDQHLEHFLADHGDDSLVGHGKMKSVIQPWGWTKLIWDGEAEGRAEKWAEVLATATAITEQDATALGARDANLFLLFDAQQRNDHRAIGAHYRRLKEHWRDDSRFWDKHGYQLNAARLIANGIPSFEIETIDSTRWTPASLLGQVTLLDFWGTWCGPCVAEIPHLKELYSERHAQGFEILGISAEDAEDVDLDAFKAWLEEHEMEWPQHYDGLMRESEIIKLFEIRGYPTTILVDRQGEVVAVNLRGVGGEGRGDYLGSRDSPPSPTSTVGKGRCFARSPPSPSIPLPPRTRERDAALLDHRPHPRSLSHLEVGKGRRRPALAATNLARLHKNDPDGNI